VKRKEGPATNGAPSKELLSETQSRPEIESSEGHHTVTASARRADR
jgi:hypothetical protein